MKLYTRRGDDGTTELVGGARVSKGDPRVAAYGGIDETNAAIGVVVATCDDPETAAMLRRIQSDLFTLGSELAAPPGRAAGVSIGESHVVQLEGWIDEATAKVAPLKQFVLPGGTQTAANLHLARSLCRRAERAAVTLAGREPVDRHALVYLNRLSDLLFALARLANHRAGVADVPWSATESGP